MNRSRQHERLLATVFLRPFLKKEVIDLISNKEKTLTKPIQTKNGGIKNLSLIDYGFIPEYYQYDKNVTYARVTAVHKESYNLITEYGECIGKLKSSVYFNNYTQAFPTTGDFVEIQYNDSGTSVIMKTLKRISKFSRNDYSGHAAEYVKTIKEQTVAANFDYVFIMQSLNHDLNLKRLERYLAQSWQSGATPVVILTKADLVEDYSDYLDSVNQIANGVKVHVISAHTGHGLDTLEKYLKKSVTIVFLGSSGVGKSSLVNALNGEEVMTVKDIREVDSKGRHTTTHRQLIRLDSGVMIIDTPGMRELGIWDVANGISESFADVEKYMGQCKYKDCKHVKEPGCAIRNAIEDGNLSFERYESYLKLQKEAAFVHNKSTYMRNKNHQNVTKKLYDRKMKKVGGHHEDN